MNASIFSELAHEWHDDEDRIAGWFRRHDRQDAAPDQHGDTITPSQYAQPAPGATVSLASIAADVRTAAENAVAEGRKLLDEHLPQIEALGELIGSNPVFASAEAASHVPLELLQGIATLLDTMAAAHPKPQPVPVAEVPAEGEQQAA